MSVVRRGQLVLLVWFGLGSATAELAEEDAKERVSEFKIGDRPAMRLSTGCSTWPGCADVTFPPPSRAHSGVTL